MLVADADICAALKKQGNDIRIAGQRGDDERRVARIIGLRDAGAAIQRLPDLVEFPAPDRIRQRRREGCAQPKEEHDSGSPKISHKELLRPHRWYPRAEKSWRYSITNPQGRKE
jgi:hypothetical protein